MQSRVFFSGGLMLLFLFMCLTTSSAAQDYYIQKGGSGPNVYESLEQLREDVDNNTITLLDGDVIYVTNDDDSLTQAFEMPGNGKVNIVSSGGRYTISGRAGDGGFSAVGSAPQLQLDGIRVTGQHSTTNSAVTIENNNALGTTMGELTINDAVFEGNQLTGPVIKITGNVIANINNTTMQNSGSNSRAIEVYTHIGGNNTLNLNFDREGVRTVWNTNPAGGGLCAIDIEAAANSTVAFNVNVADNSVFDLRDQITILADPGAHVEITKNGGGVWKVSKYDYLEGTSLTVNEGTFHARGSIWESTGDMIFRDGSVFKPTLHPGNIEEVWALGDDAKDDDWVVPWQAMSVFDINRFQADPGARLEIGNISYFPELFTGTSTSGNTTTDTTTRLIYGFMFLSDPLSSTIPASMQINNKLMEADIYLADFDALDERRPDPADIDGIAIEIRRVSDLSVLSGVGSYADVYRRLSTLTEAERDLLDGIYSRGGTSGADLGHLQTIGGHIVAYSSLAMRHNHANLLKNISKRTTKFQREELEVEVTGSDWCYSENIPEVNYGEIWAFIDQSWHSQDDTGNIAGYRYNPYGIGIGYDKHFDEWIVGGVMKYDNGKMKLKSNGQTNTKVETVMASLYASWASEGYYLTGGVHFGYGWNDSASSYTMPGLVSVGKGDYNSSLYGVSGEVGYMMNTGTLDYPIRATPYGGLSYARIGRDGFLEKGAGNLNRHFMKSHWNMYDLTAGVRLSLPLERDGYTLIPSADIAYVRTIGSPSGSEVVLASNPRGRWNIEALDTNRNALRLNAGVNARFANNLDIGANYEFEWRKRATMHQLNLNLSVGF